MRKTRKQRHKVDLIKRLNHSDLVFVILLFMPLNEKTVNQLLTTTTYQGFQFTCLFITSIILPSSSSYCCWFYHVAGYTQSILQLSLYYLQFFPVLIMVWLCVFSDLIDTVNYNILFPENLKCHALNVQNSAQPYKLCSSAVVGQIIQLLLRTKKSIGIAATEVAERQHDSIVGKLLSWPTL